jgi:RimJ/RimL family protein N-acetyltransferase
MIVANEEVTKFVSEGLGFGAYPPYTCMGVERDGEIIGGVIFNCFENGTDVQVSVYGQGFGKEFLKEAGRYVFDQLNYSRFTVKTEKEYVAKLAEKLGGKREGILRSHFGAGRDAILIGVLRDEYRFR